MTVEYRHETNWLPERNGKTIAGVKIPDTETCNTTSSHQIVKASGYTSDSLTIFGVGAARRETDLQGAIDSASLGASLTGEIIRRCNPKRLFLMGCRIRFESLTAEQGSRKTQVKSLITLFRCRCSSVGRVADSYSRVAQLVAAPRS